MPTGSDRMGSISRYELLMYLQLFVIDSSIHKKILISKFFVFSEIGFFPIFQIPVFLPIFVNRDFLAVKGIFYSQSECLDTNRIQVIQCTNIDRWMKFEIKEIDKEEWTEINMDGLKHGVTIDLSDRGDRWEGDSLNGQPYGFGNFYDENNHIIYSGFIYNGKKVCQGSEFFIDNSVVKYTGCYYRNKRYGYGKSYDKKATCIHKGEWIGDQPIQSTTVT